MADASPIIGILECIELYFEGLRTSRPAPLRRAFHPAARIVGPDDGELKQMDLGQFVAFATGVTPDPALWAEVRSIEVSGGVATARVEDVYLGRRFVDHLALVHEDGRWQIYTKLWHVAEKLSSGKGV